MMVMNCSWLTGASGAKRPSPALHQAQPGHGVDAQAVPVVHGYVGKLALAGGNPAVEGLEPAGRRAGRGEGASGWKAPPPVPARIP